jgi:signal transduction histidine kinase
MTASPPDSRLERLFGDGATAFRSAFDLVPDPVGVLWAIRDPGGEIADFETGYSNPAMARMIGVPTEASIGRRLLEEAPGFGEDETFTRMRSVLDSGRPEVVEVAVSSGDGPIGRVRGVFLHRAIPFGADGVLNLVTDVTEQRQMEDELRNYANAAAHDLREPIMAADFFVQLLDRRLAEGRTPDNEQLLDRVRQTHARARSLIDGILEYARSGTALATDEVHTGALVADVAASLASAIEQLDGQLEIAELPVIRGDRAQLGRVFQNLVANGSSSTPTSRRVSLSRPSVVTRRGCSASATTASASRPTSTTTSSRCSNARTATRSRASASGSPSAARSSRRTAARSGPSPPTAPGP